VRALVDLVAVTVERETGVRLDPEVVFLGDWDAAPPAAAGGSR